MELKPQDLVVLYKQVAQAGQVWTYASLGEALGMSPSQVHRSVKRAVASGLALEKAAASGDGAHGAARVCGPRRALRLSCRHRAAKAWHSYGLRGAAIVHCHC